MTKLTLGLSAAALSVFTLAAAAMPPGGGDQDQRREMMVEHLFDRFDLNGDDQITAEERAAGRDARFKAVDANGDGQISYDEFRAAKLERAEKKWQRQYDRADQNGDGGITMAEQDERGEKMRGRMLDRIDQDGDGVITRQEALDAEPRKGRHGGKRGGDCPKDQ